MKPTEILTAEHETIKMGIKVLQTFVSRLRNREQVAPAEFAKLTRFFSEYADKLHHMKEEQLLFKVLDRAKRPEFEQMVGALTTQHFLAREFIFAMNCALLDYRKGKKGARQELLTQAQAYITLLTIHICDEDHVLFPKVDCFLSPRQTSSLLKKFSQADQVQNIKGTASKSAERVMRMHRKYCSPVSAV